MKNQIEDLFEFGNNDEEETRKYKYIKFIEALACMLIILKFIESEKTSPKSLELLRFYWAEKLNLKIKNFNVKDENSLEYK